MKFAFINYLFIALLAIIIIGCSDANKDPKPTDIITLATSSDGIVSISGERVAAKSIPFSVQAINETGAVAYSPIPAGRIFVTGYKTSSSATTSTSVNVTIKLPKYFAPGLQLPAFVLQSLTWTEYHNVAIVAPNGLEANLTVDSLLPFIIVSNNFKVNIGKDFSLANVAEVNSGSGDFTWTAGGVIKPSLSMIKESPVDYDSLTSASTSDYMVTAATASNKTWLVQGIVNGVGYVYYKVKFVSTGNPAEFSYEKLQVVTGSKVLVQSIFNANSAPSPISNGTMMNWSDDPSQIVYTGMDGNIYRVSPQSGSIPVLATKPGDIATINGAACPNFVPGSGKTISFMTGAYKSSPTDTDSNSFHLMTISPLTPIPAAIMSHRINPVDVGLSANSLILPTKMSISGNTTDRLVALWSTGLYGIDFCLNTTTTFLSAAANIKSFSLSPSGIFIAISKNDNNIYLRKFYGNEPEVLVGAGFWPSFNADGTKLGYVNGNTYYIRNIQTGTTKAYALDFGTVCTSPALAPITNHIIFRTSDGGMSLGILLD